MKKYEHWLDVIDSDEFCKDLAAAAAKQLKKTRPADRNAAIAHLQDSTSLYSPYTADLIKKELRRKQARRN